MAPITILPKSDRIGKQKSPAYKVPVVIKGNFEFHALLNKIDLEDTSLEFSLDIYVSNDGIKWRYFGGITYVGGAYDRPGIPGFGISNGENLAGKYVQIRIDVNKQVSFGAEVEDFGVHTG